MSDQQIAQLAEREYPLEEGFVHREDLREAFIKGLKMMRDNFPEQPFLGWTNDKDILNQQREYWGAMNDRDRWKALAEKQWINVKDALPEINKRILIWNGRYIAFGKFMGKNEHGLMWYETQYPFYGRIISWMEITEPIADLDKLKKEKI